MAGEDWQRLADYVVARRVELGMRDRRAFAEATGVTERTLGKLENGQHVSPSTVGMVENRLGWAPGSCRRILAGGEPKMGSPDLGQAEYEDPTLWHIASTPGLPPDVVRGLVALARNWRQGGDGTDEQARQRSAAKPPNRRWIQTSAATRTGARPTCSTTNDGWTTPPLWPEAGPSPPG